jgi:hypothetical protein
VQQVAEMAKARHAAVKAAGQAMSLTTAAVITLVEIYNTDRRGRSRIGKI